MNFSTGRRPPGTDDRVLTYRTARQFMKKSEPLRESISVNFTKREAAALKRLGNRFGSRSQQVRDCIDLKKLKAKLDLADKLFPDSTCLKQTD